MYLYFDNTGRLLKSLTHGAPARTGSQNFEIFAYFSDTQTTYPTAKLTLVKPDGSGEYRLPFVMTPNVTKRFVKTAYETTASIEPFHDGSDYTGYYYDFTSSASILLDTPGLWKAYVTLYDVNDSQAVQGEITFVCQDGPTPKDGTEWTTEDAMNKFLRILATKANIKENQDVRYFNTNNPFTLVGKTLNTGIYSVGDIVFDETTKAFYKITSFTNPTAATSTFDKIKIDLFDSTHKLLSDYVDDTNQTNRFVTAEEKAAIAKIAGTGKEIVTKYQYLSQIEADDKTVGRVFFIKNTNESKLYEVHTAGTLGNEDIIFDFNSVKTASEQVGNKLDKLTTSGSSVYAHTGSTQNEVAYSENADANTIAKRGTDGKLKVGTATENNEAVTLGQLSAVSTVANNALPKTDVVNNLETTVAGKALDARQGRVLSEKISSIESRGRYLTVWNANLGRPTDLPGDVSELTEVYTFRTGDYFIVGTSGSKFPTGASLPIGTKLDDSYPSETRQGVIANGNDTILFNGTSWVLISGAVSTVAFENVAGDPYDQSNLAGALNSKQNKVIYTNDSVTPPTGAVEGDIWVSPATDNVIEYTGENGVIVNNTTGKISADTNVVQAKLTAGDNITITNNVISAAGGTPANMVTTDTEQSVPGRKSFDIIDVDDYMTIKKIYNHNGWELFDLNAVFGNLRLGMTMVPKDNNVSLGSSSRVFQNAYINNLNGVSVSSLIEKHLYKHTIEVNFGLEMSYEQGCKLTLYNNSSNHIDTIDALYDAMGVKTDESRPAKIYSVNGFRLDANDDVTHTYNLLRAALVNNVKKVIVTALKLSDNTLEEFDATWCDDNVETIF